MSRYIDADAIRYHDMSDGQGMWYVWRDEIHDMPTADVVEVKHGKWIQHVNEPSLWSCSICETVIYSEHEEDRLKFHKWCGCCGADMRGEDDE